MLTLFSGTDRRDQQLLGQISVLFEELWEPMRFLEDLRIVWPSLTDKERREIESSRVYKDDFHRHLVEETAGHIRELLEQIKSYKYRTLRQELLDFLDTWELQEPDKIKILLAMLPRLP